MALLDDTIAIWNAGVDSVNPQSLLCKQVSIDGTSLRVGKRDFDLEPINRIFVVGAGKASGRMAKGLLQVLEPLATQKLLRGRVIVPITQVQPLPYVQLVSGRDDFHNLPTENAESETLAIIEEIKSLESNDLCIALISGGGSALLTAPLPPVTLAEKIDVTHRLSEAGASIEQLNTIRTKLSRVKGGGLIRFCPQTQVIGLLLSDVIGDRLEVVASGPTFLHPTPNVEQVKAILKSLAIEIDEFSASVQSVLGSNIETEPGTSGPLPYNCLLGNCRTAVLGAAASANDLNYQVKRDLLNPDIELADLAEVICGIILSGNERNECVILGGETRVRLVDKKIRGLGGRNQQLVLEVWKRLKGKVGEVWKENFDFCCLSGGTDGEDGPTDSAGGYLTAKKFQRVSLGEIESHCASNNAYPLLERHDQLFKPGITGTNVCDLIVLIRQRRSGLIRDHRFFGPKVHSFT